MLSRIIPLAAMALACGGGDDGSSTVSVPTETPEPSATSSSDTPAPEASTACAPGEVQACSCAGGAQGTKLCLASAVFGTCSCETVSPAPTGTNLVGCFSKDDGFDTCDAYCQSLRRECAAESCGPDGTLAPGQGYTWVSWGADDAAGCDALTHPSQMSFDACTTPIWLQPSKPRDDIVRCCCH